MFKVKLPLSTGMLWSAPFETICSILSLSLCCRIIFEMSQHTSEGFALCVPGVGMRNESGKGLEESPVKVMCKRIVNS